MGEDFFLISIKKNIPWIFVRGMGGGVQIFNFEFQMSSIFFRDLVLDLLKFLLEMCVSALVGK